MGSGNELSRDRGASDSLHIHNPHILAKGGEGCPCPFRLGQGHEWQRQGLEGCGNEGVGLDHGVSFQQGFRVQGFRWGYLIPWMRLQATHVTACI